MLSSVDLYLASQKKRKSLDFTLSFVSENQVFLPGSLMNFTFIYKNLKGLEILK